jgi:hypothetical protein
MKSSEYFVKGKMQKLQNTTDRLYHRLQIEMPHKDQHSAIGIEVIEKLKNQP